MQLEDVLAEGDAPVPDQAMDLVAALEAEAGTTQSAEVNSALRAEFTRRKRQQALADLLDHLAEVRGALDTPEDEAEIARYRRLPGGMADDPAG